MNKKLELGIQAIVALRKKSGFVKTSDIAAEIGTTTVFLNQIMHDLRVAELVVVKRGPGGGYTIHKENITALDVAKAVGRDLGEISFSVDPRDVLKNNIIKAYFNTEI